MNKNWENEDFDIGGYFQGKRHKHQINAMNRRTVVVLGTLEVTDRVKVVAGWKRIKDLAKMPLSEVKSNLESGDPFDLNLNLDVKEAEKVVECLLRGQIRAEIANIKQTA